MLRFMALELQEGFFLYLLFRPFLHRKLELNKFLAGTTKKLIIWCFSCPACEKPPTKAEEPPALEEISFQFSLLFKHKVDKLCLKLETPEPELSLQSCTELAAR